MLNKATQMDFIRILRSLEEFLYEVMTWLVFYPRTLLRTALRPIEVLEYSRTEMRKPEEEQFQDALSAPLFLMLTLVISHSVELAITPNAFPVATKAGTQLFGSYQNLVLLRSLMFAAFPLMFALQQVKDAGQSLTRQTLRGPFFGECYPAAVFCLVFGIGGSLAQTYPHHRPVGLAMMAVAIVWYFAVQVVWLKRFNDRWSRAALMAAAAFLKATLVMLTVAVCVALAIKD
ncbi:hypothetical protein [Caulobacter sp. RHG1]|uniref:hypothetical protein n=1 Tax=Caulobacter sp. (strain RHG1) TaxID=2545762 RepID=UPI0015536688|nr:hypothetical protein [Caulobacter sp. RHG1]NQE64008.1 hypothetical protein [Caulobacter sp. RHG1]